MVQCMFKANEFADECVIATVGLIAFGREEFVKLEFGGDVWLC